MRRTFSHARIHRAAVTRALDEGSVTAGLEEAGVRAHAPVAALVDGERRIAAKDVAEVPGPGRRVVA